MLFRWYKMTLPCEDVRGSVEDLIAGFVGLESARHAAANKTD